MVNEKKIREVAAVILWRFFNACKQNTYYYYKNLFLSHKMQILVLFWTKKLTYVKSKKVAQKVLIFFFFLLKYQWLEKTNIQDIVNMSFFITTG